MRCANLCSRSDSIESLRLQIEKQVHSLTGASLDVLDLDHRLAAAELFDPDSIGLGRARSLHRSDGRRHLRTAPAEAPSTCLGQRMGSFHLLP